MEVATITWKGRFGPVDLVRDPSTFAPSTISQLLADAMDVRAGETVIDVGSGTGILGIIAAKLGAARVLATDRSPHADQVGKLNALRLGVADRVEFFLGNLFDSLPSGLRADVIVGDVSGIPDELAAESGWFPDGSGGGPTGIELPVQMLRDAVARLRRGGRVLLPTGSLQDETTLLDTARSIYRRVEQVAERHIPLPARLAESDVMDRLTSSGVARLISRGSRKVWEARIWRLSGA